MDATVEVQTENSVMENTINQPRPGRATGWFFVFILLQVLAGGLYAVGQGAYEGYLAASQGQAVDPVAVEASVEQQMDSPSALAAISLLSYVLFLPLLIVISRFHHQSASQTLALSRFPSKMLVLWLPVLLLFIGAQGVLDTVFKIEPGEFMQSLAGSRHLLIALVMVVGAPLIEELLFRGYLFKAWRHTRLGFTGTLLLTSALFTAMHMGQYHAIQLAYVFVLALILGIAREKSGSVLLPVLLHMVNNLISVVLVVYLGIL